MKSELTLDVLSTPSVAHQEPSDQEELVIEAGQGLKHYWRDLWNYRELFCFLAWRDISVRYKQTAIGVSWSVICPFFTMVVFTVIYGKLAKLPADGFSFR